MMIMPAHALGVVVAGALAVTWPHGSSVARSIVGTLTCTADVPGLEPRSATAWKIDCTLEHAGAKGAQHFSGQVSGLRAEAQGAGKAFLVWTVMAEDQKLATSVLVGTYEPARNGQPSSPSLIGGRDQAILLEPLLDARERGVNLAPAVKTMQLELPRV